jgi:hypothetical protein
MIVRVSEGSWDLVEVEDLRRLHVEVADGTAAEVAGRVDGADHVWLDVAALRAAGQAKAGDPGWAERFDSMIDYARSKGWLDEAGTAVRAHIERP